MLQPVTLIFNTVCYPAQCSSVKTKDSRLPLGCYKNKATTSALLLINPIHTRSTRETKLVRKTKLVCETDQRHVLVAYRVVTGVHHNGLLVVIISRRFLSRRFLSSLYTLVSQKRWSEYFFMTKAAANERANFKTVTRTIQFLRNQWFLKHDLLKLHYSQLPTTIIMITKRNIKRQKTTQNVPDSLDRRSTRDAAKKRAQHDKLHNITVLFARKFQHMYTDARGLKPNLQINRSAFEARFGDKSSISERVNYRHFHIQFTN